MRRNAKTERYEQSVDWKAAISRVYVRRREGGSGL
jgi:hypothetical protein